MIAGRLNINGYFFLIQREQIPYKGVGRSMYFEKLTSAMLTSFNSRPQADSGRTWR